ncbi:hypothetical protein [Pelagicoccus albus]|uniref:TonB C-terminal domain-containing protein n=1 Tax=Pelagicoccus albus TaxID=415222 RepID=A0A7X1B2R3_9BACT|nr:hypothetical protein [Pelagicoccus albus]MBC2604571.1 hypothetical protein [Pelagicoccus albus]
MSKVSDIESLLTEKAFPASSYLAGVLTSAAIFALIAISQFREMPTPSEPETQLTDFYLPPPPPPKPATPPTEQRQVEIDFSVPIDPSPFELSLDYLNVRIGPQTEQFKKVAFDIDESIESFRQMGLSRMQVFDNADLDEPPIPLRRSTPSFPLGYDGVTLKALVQYRVTDQGITENIMILSCNIPEMNDRIVECIRQWTFKPAIKEEQPVHSWARHTISIQNKVKPDSPFAL